MTTSGTCPRAKVGKGRHGCVNKTSENVNSGGKTHAVRIHIQLPRFKRCSKPISARRLKVNEVCHQQRLGGLQSDLWAE